MKKGYETTDATTYHLLLEKAKENRNNPTAAEKHLWRYLKGNLLGAHFRQQHPIYGFIPDFVCLQQQLIIEIDGGYHLDGEQPEKDEERTQWLKSQGYRVLRFTNEEVLQETEAVITKIKEALNNNNINPQSGNSLPQSNSNNSLPWGGDGVGNPQSGKPLPWGGDGVGITIVKVGGAIVEDERQLSMLLDNFSAIPGRKVLIHGGGRRATQVASQLGIESQMVNGRRITDEKMLNVVTMVYGGLVNKQLVARLQAHGVNALGLTGADMDIVRSHRRPVKDVDYGFVGDVDKVDGERLAALLEAGITPVLAPLTHDGNGTILNTNADTIASVAAQALAPFYEVTLIYSFEKPGVLRDPDDDSSVIPHITRTDFDRYVADGTISGGMIPKIENALAAVEAGVRRVIITLATAIDGEHGTVIE
ncbi:MAG: acetylglutamate kinase [Prevotella sp.]|nr:acetylglutamate kinase [Prevotella sp.]